MSKEAALEVSSIVVESDHDDPDGPAQDAKKRKATGAAAHRVLKRIEGKRVRLSQRQLAEISIYANKHKTLSREDVIHWAVEKFSLTESPHVAEDSSRSSRS